jgi:hypothetical protein
VGYTERAAHGGVVSELVSSTFLAIGLAVCFGASNRDSNAYFQSNSCVRLHDMPYVLNQLSNTCAHFSSSNADDHALRIPIFYVRLLVRSRLLLPSITSTRHDFGRFTRRLVFRSW